MTKYRTVAEIIAAQPKSDLSKNLQYRVNKGEINNNSNVILGSGQISDSPRSNMGAAKTEFKNSLVVIGGKKRYRTEGYKFAVVEI